MFPTAFHVPYRLDWPASLVISTRDMFSQLPPWARVFLLLHACCRWEGSQNTSKCEARGLLARWTCAALCPRPRTILSRALDRPGLGPCLIDKRKTQ